jgi:DNA-binding cell septation regulator SpoVG
MALASLSRAKSVSSGMVSQDKSFQVVLLRKPYGVVLSLVQINSNSSLVIRDGKVVDLEDGLFIQPFAEFSLN